MSPCLNVSSVAEYSGETSDWVIAPSGTEVPVRVGLIVSVLSG